MNPSDDAAGPRSARDLSRRDFLKKGSLVSLVGALGVPTTRAEEALGRPVTPRPAGQRPPVTCAVIGYGAWGREVAATLARMPEAALVAVCDPYDVMLQRARRTVPQAATHADYRVVLDDPDVQAVFVATPTHLHRDIVLTALDAGKHVYCEAPMAATLDEARAIARAARAASNQIFQVGQIYRSDPQYRAVFQFIRSGAIGKPTMARAQWHTKQSWRRASPNPQREVEQNWRLDAEVSAGLMGEVGLHQLDMVFRIFQTRPVSVTGFGQIMLWDDGRRVPDTIQAVFAFPDGMHLVYDATLASSFDGIYDAYYGSDSTILLRDSKAWMFKEVDAPLLGWEVYARKDQFYKETGIALVANATKLEAQGLDPTADDPNAETPLYHALKEFMDNYVYGPFPPSAGYQEGYDAVVAAVKANEAITQHTKVTFDEAWFDLG